MLVPGLSSTISNTVSSKLESLTYLGRPLLALSPRRILACFSKLSSPNHHMGAMFSIGGWRKQEMILSGKKFNMRTKAYVINWRQESKCAKRSSPKKNIMLACL